MIERMFLQNQSSFHLATQLICVYLTARFGSANSWMGVRQGNLDPQRILEQRHLSATEYSISTDRADLPAIVRHPHSRADSCRSRTAHAQISRYVGGG